MSSTHEPLDQLLSRLWPLQELKAENRVRLAEKAKLVDLNPGLRLNARDEHRWINYLLTGKVNLMSNGKPHVLEADSSRALRPLFGDERLQDYAVALTQGRLLRVDRQLFETFKADETSTGIELEDVEYGPTEGAIIARLYQDCMSNQLDLPSVPDVALKIQRATEDPATDLNDLARIVQMDMAVTGGLIKAANSAMYGGTAPVNHVRDAIRRLGTNATRQLVISIAMGQVFKTDVPSLKQRMHTLWDHSVHVSALCYVIARHCGRLDAEHALLAGLLHDVGVVPILDYVGKHQPDIDPEELERIIARLHALTGELVINHWGLGPDMSLVVREADHWERAGGEKVDYCDVIQVAQLYAYAKAGRNDVPRFDAVPAFSRLCLSEVCAGDRIDPVEEAEAEIRAVMDMLRGD
ncbi:HDOD domain-containing protein [Thioalkalivibrio sulfidiphilus]|uniref:Metal dependent phosphohydrolase n=1 Tax=Thioalkalivibrio sulfidiphilus (strain HL-EbGR7) TaxID=396588 RepID=B8GMV5_THISH|nr:HDOD domain-containing protein [Thioalkalivibrio sulfidiphilus]ACL73770.1 metal dependent phosphohydrolase [Thioalkalivibrio sulfidiphilus HL-EbGr7]